MLPEEAHGIWALALPAFKIAYGVSDEVLYVLPGCIDCGFSAYCVHTGRVRHAHRWRETNSG
jgi:hypothetical protein